MHLVIACVTPFISDSREVHELTAKMAIVAASELRNTNRDGLPVVNVAE